MAGSINRRLMPTYVCVTGPIWEKHPELTPMRRCPILLLTPRSHAISRNLTHGVEGIWCTYGGSHEGLAKHLKIDDHREFSHVPATTVVVVLIVVP